MLGVAAPPPPTTDSVRPRADVHYGEATVEDVQRYQRRQRSKVPLIVVLVLGVLIFVGGVGTAIVLVLLRDAPTIRASVLQTEEGERLRIEVPGAEDGAKVRFDGREAALEGGTATFEITAETLQIGDNALSIDVVDPSGDVASSQVTLTVSYRVRANLDPLGQEPPVLEIVGDALPGSTLTVDGQAVALDERGHGVVRLPVTEATGTEDGVFEHTAAYRVQLPDGASHDGTVSTRVPYTALRIDRPSSELVTDRDTVEIAGVVAPDATVFVDGTAVETNDGRFVHRHPLAELGTFNPAVVARQPGRAPRRVTLTVRRVADLAREAAGFDADRSLTYARIMSNVASYRGQRIALEGRVYNVDASEGRSVLQILVRSCPGGQRCPLWVNYPAATDVTPNSWVRVLGTVAGEQQFRSQSNEVRTVPRVDAVFVLALPR
jgi:hypothetical protein